MAKGPREWRPRRLGGEKYVLALVDCRVRVPVEELEPELAHEYEAQGVSRVTFYSAGIYPVYLEKWQSSLTDEEWEVFVYSVAEGEKESLYRTGYDPSMDLVFGEAKAWAEDNRFNVLKTLSLY
jgi:hypothetical protein